MVLPQAGDGYLLLMCLATSSSPSADTKGERETSHLQQNVLGTAFHCSLKQLYCNPVQKAESSALNAVAPCLHQNCHNYCFSNLHMVL